MSRDSTDDLIEEMKGMEEKSLGRSLPSNRRNYEVGGEYCCYFPILDLPNELIAHIFSFLSIEDRMKARVHKKLNAIELESKYFLYDCELLEYISKKKKLSYGKEQGIIFNASKIYSSDCIRRISQNVSIGQISIKLNPYLSYYREMYHLLKNVDIDHLILDCTTFVHIEFVLTRSFFVELRRVCRLLVIPFVVYSITAKDLHELYKVMIDCSSKLKIREMGVGMNNWHDFLSLIGITINFGHPFSTRHIEAFSRKFPGGLRSYYRELYFFDGMMEIWYRKSTSSVSMRLKVHESKESLDNLKYDNNLDRINVVVE